MTISFHQRVALDNLRQKLVNMQVFAVTTAAGLNTAANHGVAPTGDPTKLLVMMERVYREARQAVIDLEVVS